jgi:hypothetical protein
MCADIRDGQEQKRSIQGPDTEAQDQLSPDHHIQLAMHGRSIHKCHVWTAPAVQEGNLMFPQNCEATNGLHLNLQVRRATLWRLARNKKFKKFASLGGGSNAGC